jgi:DNA-binding NtrC family response regulator
LSTSEREALLASASNARAEAQDRVEAVDSTERSERTDYVPLLETARILVVDDEKVIREILADFLTMEGYVVHAVEDGAQAIEELRKRSYNLVISDLKMPNLSGLELIQKISEESIPVLTVIMTGFGTVETAIDAMKR